MRILLIEDDTLIGDGLKTGLEKLGFSVDWFDDGDDGQEALFQAPYDAVVLDLGLPGADGLEILQHWRQKGRKEPVLILTARGDVDQRILGLNCGADDYLGKPFALKEVQARLNVSVGTTGIRPRIFPTRISILIRKPEKFFKGERKLSFLPRSLLFWNY